MCKYIPKLIVELIPKSCWFSSVRTMVSKKDWDRIRKLTYNLANNKCEICGKTGLEQGYKHNVECHEVWAYDTVNFTQKLTKLTSLCVICHLVKHIGRANAMGKQPEVFKQLETVNNWDHKQVVQHVAESFELYKERSKYQWSLDLSILKKPPYGLTIKENVQRKYVKPKFKKKRKKRKK